MKKAFCLTLVFLFLLNTLCLSSGAAGTISVNNEQNASEYTSTLHDGVLRTSDGEYILEVGSGVEKEYYPAGRMDIDFSDPQSVSMALNDVRIAEEMKGYISSEYEKAVRTGNMQATMTVYSQELLPATRTSETTYRTYNGVEMRTDRIYYQNLMTRTETLVRGINTEQVAANTTGITLSVLGLCQIPYISAVAGGLSLLQAFISAAAGNVNYVTGSSSDFVEYQMTYDTTTQWTYARIGTDWQLGLVSQSAEIIGLETVTYFYNPNTHSGKSNRTITEAGTVIRSQNFHSPWAAAYQNMNSPVEEWVGYYSNGVVVYF